MSLALVLLHMNTLTTPPTRTASSLTVSALVVHVITVSGPELHDFTLVNIKRHSPEEEDEEKKEEKKDLEEGEEKRKRKKTHKRNKNNRMAVTKM